MDEDNSAKAPVTRLRRRLSVESTEEKSSTPNTPTKKRGRLPKPQLDLIDENAVTQQTLTPKRVTRKTTKDALETVEDKPLTPVRRSTRVKSNTSIVSDTAATTTGDTTRAKRATRRNSQLGSDNETLLTPTRQTRRTRKDSTPNPDNGESDKPVPQITEIIDEESKILDKGLSTPPNSQVLMKNTENSDTVNEKVDTKLDNNVCNTSTIKSNKNESLVSTNLSPELQKENISPGLKQINLSPCTVELVKNIDAEKCLSIDALNKTTSFMETSMKPYKKRTKSLSTICMTPEEALKSKETDINKSQPQIYNGSGDSNITNASTEKNSKTPLLNPQVVLNRFELNQVNKNVSNINKSKDKSCEELLNMDPNEFSKPEIIIEEFALSGLAQNIQNTEDQIMPVDTSSPNINASINESKMNKDVVVSNSEKVSNDSVEPMDIDQTISESMLIIPDENKSFVNDSVNIKSRQNSIEPESKRKSSLELIDSENKTTLLLTQVNDNVLGKSPLPSDTPSSNSLVIDLDRTQTVENEQKKLSLNCLTSTPLQEKYFNKLLVPMNASIIKSHDNNHDSIKTSSIVNSPIVTSSINKNKDNEFSEEKSSLVQNHSCDEIIFGNKSTAISPQMNSIARHKANDKDDDSPHDTNMTLSEKVSDKGLSKQFNNKSKENKTVMNDETSNNMTSKDEDLSKLKDKSSASASKKILSEEPSDSDTSNNSSMPKNDLINDEAEDAGDDYESGDSQNEDEHQYAKENEIIDKGVTLTSEEDFSNDSDYEKDSFVVSSDEDDNQLLEGTEDDLSMSDNELKMTAKSKNKYNKRMIKEQKRASKEMYESRHKLNIKKKEVVEENDDSKSDDSDHSPKQRKKSNRMRLDSSHETSVLIENKKWNTQDENLLTESVVNDSCMDEKEITQINNVGLQENDPLTTSMKNDPTSPKYDNDKVNVTLDFISEQSDPKSSINVCKPNVDRDDNSNDPSDPHDKTSSDDSDTIINNYDSVLKDLNEANSTKNVDTSLNLELKKKLKNKRASIIDEINLTQFETRKTKKEDSLRLENTRKQNNTSNKSSSVNESEDSSDSVDPRLLFSEESNSDSINTKNSDDNDAIPLKQSEAKTDLRINEDENMQCASDDIFFIDTKGNRKCDDEPTENVTFKNTAIAITPKSDEKNQNLFKSQADVQVSELNISNAKTPKSEKKKKKNLSQSQSDNLDKSTKDMIIEEQDTEDVKTPKSEKKKKLKLSDSQADDDVPPKEENIIKELASSKIKTPKSDKKKKQKLSESEVSATPIEEIIISDLDTSSAKTPRSDKKKKQKLTESQTMQERDSSNAKTPKSDKKKRQELTDCQENIQERDSSNAKTPKSDKKKRQELTDCQENIQERNSSNVKTPKSDKKKKQELTDFQENIQERDSSNAKTPKSDKKKRQELTDCQENIQERNSSNVKTPKSDKKKKQELTDFQENIQERDSSNAKTPKSDKKKKQELTDFQENIQERDSSNAKTPKSDKKKKEELTDSQENIQELNSSNSKTSKSDKKKKLSEKHENIQGIPNEEMDIEGIDSFNVKTPKSDKKKNRKLIESKADIFEDVPTEEIIIKELNSSNLKILKSDKKKKQKLTESKAGIKDTPTEEIIIKELTSSNENIPINDKKKKRMLSGVQAGNIEVISTENKQETETSVAGTSKRDKKKKKEMVEILADNVEDGHSLAESNYKKKRKRSPTVPTEEIMGNIILQNNGNENKKRKINDCGTVKAVEVKKNKKRKEREDDKHHLQKIQPTRKMTVPRLPTSVVTQLEDKPKIQVKKKPKVISTSQFIVEDSRRNKPSNYLEESVYLNDDSPERKKPKKNIPKVLPTMPSSSSSDHGFTTTFKINVLPAETKFVASATNNIANFKENNLYNKIQRRGTYEHYKKQRSMKLSKF